VSVSRRRLTRSRANGAPSLASTAGRSIVGTVVSRLVQAVIVVAIVTTIVFILIHIAPGDPFTSAMDNPNVTEAMRAKWRAMYGLDRPLLEQYALYLSNAARGDFGWSFSMHRPVIDVLKDALPNTLLLAGTALVIGFAGGIGLAVIQATRPGSRTDRTLGAGSMFFYAMPDFWLALMMMLIFAYWLPWFPVAGAVDPVMHEYMGPLAAFGDRLKHLALPAITLALLSGAAIARYQRAELLRVLPDDFVRTARAKGVGERRVMWVHVLRNALIPTISLLGLSLPVLFTGAVFIERVFAWPGMGWVILNGVATRDYPLVTAGVIVAAATVTLGSLAADLLYSVADPRIRGR
jgi:peptide/nickel transport system permease protein